MANWKGGKMREKTYLTRKGYTKLEKELQELKRVKRPALSKEIGIAREHGDLKENAEYTAAREALAHVMRRIHEIETKLATGQLIDEKEIPADKIYIGATVFLKDLQSKEELSYTLVGADEVELSENKISIQSPLANGLLGHGVGETVEIPLPAGTFKYEILKIQRTP